MAEAVSSSNEPSEPLFYLYLVTSCFSIVGTTLVILSTIVMPKLRQHPTRLAIFLAISDWMFAAKYLSSAIWGGPNSFAGAQKDIPCLVSGLWGNFFGSASVLWNTAIAVNILLTLFNPFMSTVKMEWVYHIVAWGYSAASTILIGSIPGTVGPSGDGTCWIATGKKYLRLTFFTPVAFGVFVALTTLVFAYTRRKMLRISKTSRSVMINLIFYTAAFAILWSGALVHRSWQIIAEKNEAGLVFLDAICVGSLGFVNSIIWMTNSGFISEFKKLIGRIRRNCCGKVRFKVSDDGEHLLSIDEEDDDGEAVVSIALALRTNLIWCGLNGIRISTTNTKRSGTFTEEDYRLVIAKKLACSSSLGDTSRAVELVSLEQFPNSYDSVAVPFSPDNSDNSAFDTGTDKQDSYRMMTIQNESEQEVMQFLWWDYMPTIFRDLRAQLGVDTPSFLQSLAPEQIMEIAKGKVTDGRSGSFFFFSPDKRYLIKTIPKSESRLLRSILPHYHKHLLENPNSLLSQTRVCGCFALRLPPSRKLYLVVLANVFCTGNKMHERYDLKGSWINRSAGSSHEDAPEDVLGMDLDFKRSLNFPEGIGDLFKAEITKDARLLQSLGIIDYSLLVGVHKLKSADSESADEKSESKDSLFYNYQGGILSRDGKEIYYVGIIDMLTLYNFKKKRERFLKTKVLHKDSAGISVQVPAVYAQRFLEFVESIAT
eukprot:TRINITY_DN19723_c0_g1_i1.p1 TRINITY_DN19723_c0_g1~~TRINITY_DN19723_c0_g1_i1.p1  ORF type:complete len:711 (-),score=81.49 TRINITY_DN19723_c0_g1_i1:84-2216(-)